MESDFVPVFDPDFAPVIDLRTRDSECSPTLATVTFAQPGMAPATVSVLIDCWAPKSPKFDRDVAAMGDILHGLAHGIMGSFLQPATEAELLGYRTGLISAGAHRLSDDSGK